MVHKNIFGLASRHFSWIFTVKYASIGDSIVISLGHKAMQRACKGTRKKVCESKNLKNSETHGAGKNEEMGNTEGLRSTWKFRERA